MTPPPKTAAFALSALTAALGVGASVRTESVMAFSPPPDFVVAPDELELRPALGLMVHHGKPFTGLLVGTHRDGRLRQRIMYRRGKKHGLSEQFFEDGKRSYESNYRNGRQHGEARTWWRNGNLRSLSRFVDGTGHGVQEQWYVGGTRFKRIQLDHGRERGRQQSWRANGSLYNNYEARNGRTYGLKRSKLCYRVDDQELQIKP